MTAAQYGFWDVCRSLAHKNKILFFNGRSIAERFQGMSKSTAYLLAEALVEAGWFKLVKDSTRRKDGTFSPKQYQVLSHEEWAHEHPGGCEPVQPAGLDDISPVQPADSPVQPADQPVQPAGHNLLLELPTQKQSATESDNHTPFQPVGLDGFVNRFSKKKRGQPQAAAPNLERRPVQPVGQAELTISKADAADRIATAIVNTIGANASEHGTWADGARDLLDRGHSMNEIIEVADFVNKKCKPGTLRINGAGEFVKNYSMIHTGMVSLRNQEAQKGKSA
jgi:hypothetical protein